MMSWHRDGHNSCHIARCSFGARLADISTFPTGVYVPSMQGVSFSVSTQSFVGQGLGLCCVNMCIVILIFQPGSLSKRTDTNGYPTSCQDGVKHTDFSIKTMALKRGERMLEQDPLILPLHMFIVSAILPGCSLSPAFCP